MDPVSTAKADTVSGSRLKAKYYVGNDGSKQFIQWHDSQLDADCYFAQTASGLRCLPAYITANAYYADAACSVALFLSPKPACGTTAPVPKLGIKATTANGCTTTQYFLVTKVPFPAQLYLTSGSTCTLAPASTATALDPYDFFTGMPTDLSQFVSAKESIE
jgi:hypothetical protein